MRESGDDQDPVAGAPRVVCSWVGGAEFGETTGAHKPAPRTTLVELGEALRPHRTSVWAKGAKWVRNSDRGAAIAVKLTVEYDLSDAESERLEAAAAAGIAFLAELAAARVDLGDQHERRAAAADADGMITTVLHDLLEARRTVEADISAGGDVGGRGHGGPTDRSKVVVCGESLTRLNVACFGTVIETVRTLADGRNATIPYVRLWVLVGGDRFTVTLQPFGRPTVNQHVPNPCSPIKVQSREAVEALGTHLKRHGSEALVTLTTRTLEMSADESTPMNPRALLAGCTALFRTLAAAEVDSASLRKALQALKTLNAKGVVLQADDLDAAVAQLDDADRTIHGLRDRVVQLQQVVIASAAFEQALALDRVSDEAHRISTLAAVVIVPSVVAAVLGSNVLPWNTATLAALVGLLVLMAASGVFSLALLPRGSLSRLWSARRAGVQGAAAAVEPWRLAWAAGAVGLLALGVFLVARGTSTSDAASPSVAPHGTVVASPHGERDSRGP